MSHDIEIFQSQQKFHQAFEDGLVRLLDDPALGTFILATANATLDAEIYEDTRGRLKELYESFAGRYHHALKEGQLIDEVDEDLLVFLKMHTIGFDALQTTQIKNVGPWELQFNHLRAFRPRRISNHDDDAIRAAFDSHGFNFNKAFLQKEAFWEGHLEGKTVSFYYNKYPFADLHGIVVPEREQRHPQFLTPQHHQYIWHLCKHLAPQLEGVGFGYNSYGAFASVNHLHFQMFVHKPGLPVTQAVWQHNGGQRPYPTTCHCFDDEQAAWQAIEQLHRQSISYNLIYHSQRLYLFPRKKQGKCNTPGWSSGFTWHEMGGGMVVFNHSAFESLSEQQIEQELCLLTI